MGSMCYHCSNRGGAQGSVFLCYVYTHDITYVRRTLQPPNSDHTQRYLHLKVLTPNSTYTQHYHTTVMATDLHTTGITDI